MKKSLFAVAVSSAIVSTANAQSSVTLYGIVDAGLTYTSNAKGSAQYALTSGNENGSRWGLTGAEDLGGNLKAVFTLESGFSTTTGAILQNGTEFGRQAFVGLSSGDYGTATLGRQYGASYSIISAFLALNSGGDWAAGGIGYGTHAADLDNLDSSNRIANSIKYQSPNIGGFTFSGLYSLGGKAGNVSQNGILDFAVAYVNGPVKLGAGYFFAKDPNFSFWGDKTNDSATGSNISNVIISGYASAGSQQIVTAGGGYTFGSTTVSLTYSNVQFGSLGSVGDVTTGVAAKYSGSATLNTGELNVKYRFSPALVLGVSYSYTKDGGADGDGGAKYQIIDAGAIYSLSKRTSLFAVVVYQKASGINSLGENAVADIVGTSAPSATNHQIVATAGLTARF